MPWVKKFNGAEAQLIHDDLTVKGLSEYVVRKLRNFGGVRPRPMPCPVLLAFNLMPMCISLHLLIDCLGEKALALFLFSRFGLFTSPLCLIQMPIVSEIKAQFPKQEPTCSSSAARFIISEAKEPTTSTGGAILVEIQSCAAVTT